MAEVREGLKYTDTDEWVKIEGNIAVVGITDYAQSELSDIVAIMPKKVGGKLKKGESLAEVEAVKTASELFAPLSGEIVEINERVVTSPEIINQSPYDEGWIAKLSIEDKDELSSLMDADEYKKKHG